MKSSEIILVVEDHETLREQIVQALEMEGYRVTAAANGREAMDVMRTSAPSLVVSDIAMPEMDGHEFVRRLRASPDHAATPVVFLTARADRAAVREGMNLGADDYVTKPFGMEELLGAIDTRLRRRSETDRVATQEAARERGRMMLMLPHELRTPLTGIVGFAEVLRSELIPGRPVSHEVHEMLDGILLSGDRLERLATNLVLHLQLELARQDPAQRQLFVDAGPAAVGDQTIAVAERVATNHRRLPDLRWRAAGSVAVAFSPHFFEKALKEIIDNAFKFSTPQSLVEISVKTNGARAEITVADRGVGIAADEASRMAPFQQWRRAQREQQGLGLGFAIARRLLEFNGCSLAIAPRAGGGATVQLSLPIVEV